MRKIAWVIYKITNYAEHNKIFILLWNQKENPTNSMRAIFNRQKSLNESNPYKETEETRCMRIIDVPIGFAIFIC